MVKMLAVIVVLTLLITCSAFAGENSASSEQTLPNLNAREIQKLKFLIKSLEKRVRDNENNIERHDDALEKLNRISLSDALNAKASKPQVWGVEFQEGEVNYPDVDQMRALVRAIRGGRGIKDSVVYGTYSPGGDDALNKSLAIGRAGRCAQILGVAGFGDLSTRVADEQVITSLRAAPKGDKPLCFVILLPAPTPVSAQ